MNTPEININHDSPIALVESNHDGQFPRQMPIWLEISLSEDEPAQVRAVAVNWSMSSGIPMSQYHGHDQTLQLPANVDASELHDFVKTDIALLVERVSAGYTSEWDGNNHIARFTDDARSALEGIERTIKMAPTYDEGGLWDLGDWLDASESRPTHTDPTAVVFETDITGKTADDELEALAELIMAGAVSENVVLDGDVSDYLTEIRNECREMEGE